MSQFPLFPTVSLKLMSFLFVRLAQFAVVPIWGDLVQPRVWQFPLENIRATFPGMPNIWIVGLMLVSS